jgi:hypothetical protein
MLRKFVAAAITLVLVVGVAVAQKQDKGGKGGKGNKGPRAQVGKITKIDGDKITVAVRKGKKETEDKTFTLTKDTKYMQGRKQITESDKIKEFKATVLKVGGTVRVQADADGNVKTISKAGGGKKPKTDK